MATYTTGEDLWGAQFAYQKGSNSTWNIWTTTDSNDSTGQIWGQWTTPTLTTYTSGLLDSNYSTLVWDSWNQIFKYRNTSNAYYQQYTPAPVELTAAQLAEQAKIDAEFAKREEENRKKQAVRAEKAKAILLSVLTPDQRASYEKDLFFDVHSKDGKRRYRIKKGRSGNVKLLNEKGEEVKSYCCHTVEYLPDEDTLVAQKLAIEHDEETFLKAANVTVLRAA